jgi:hypothetical protein
MRGEVVVSYRNAPVALSVAVTCERCFVSNALRNSLLVAPELVIVVSLANSRTWPRGTPLSAAALAAGTANASTEHAAQQDGLGAGWQDSIDLLPELGYASCNAP